jgi:hypothetical protein
MFFIKGNCKREINRGAYGIKTLKVSEDIENGDAVSIDVDQENLAFIVSKEDKLHVDASHEYIEDYAEIKEEEINILTDRISPVMNFDREFKRKTLVEITFADDKMLVSLISGAIYIDSPIGNGEELLAFRNVPEINYEGKGVSPVTTWLSTEKMKSTLIKLFNIDEQFVDDYVFEVFIDVRNGVVSYLKNACYDISLGFISDKKAKEENLQIEKESVRAEYVVDPTDDYEDLGVGSLYDDDYEDEDEYDEDDEYAGFYIVGGSDED